MVTLTLLGCGTSTGVPVIGCDCEVCTSGHPRNNRLRAAAHVQAGDVSILIDTGPDLRQQVLREGIGRLDAVLYTHSHADHLHGIDDLRMFSFRSNGIDAYARRDVIASITGAFGYIFQGAYEGGMPPMVRLHEITGEESLDIKGVTVMPIPIYHGKWPILGYRFGSIAYLTDCKTITPEGYERLAGVETLIIDGLREEPPHPTHMTVAESLATIDRIGPRKAYLTHMTHNMDYRNPPQLPDHVEMAYDGLQVTSA